MLEVKNLSTGYDGIDVVHDVSLQVNGGENLCMLGANGCGKSTIIKAISGYLPKKGSIEIDGLDIEKMKRKELARKIGVMSQVSSIYFSYSVYETVLLGRYLHLKENSLKRPSKKDKEYIKDCLHAVNLYDVKDKQINTLSGGQLQRVFLARTFAQDPNIILLDEPTNHLDLKHQLELVEYLKNWTDKKNRAVIGVFHDINLAMTMADKVLLLDQGKVAAYGGKEEVLTSKKLQLTYGIDVVSFMRKSLEQWENVV